MLKEDNVYLYDTDTTVAAKVAEIKAEVDKVSNTVVARTEVDLTTLDPTTGKRAVRSAETNLGDLCADAYRELLKTDVAFVNGGGVRANINKGDITYGQIIAVHPFGNTACKIEVTGEQLWTALEIGSAACPGESGGFLQVSGLTYEIDLNGTHSVRRSCPVMKPGFERRISTHTRFGFPAANRISCRTVRM